MARGRAVAARVLAGCLLAAAVAACGPGGPDGGADAALEGAVGFGEQRDSAIGAHAVAGLVRLDPDDVAGERPDVGDDEQLVAAVVSECASAERSGVVSGRGWSAILDDGSSVGSTGDPVPATEGAPPLASDRRVAAGSCAWARILFVVPADRDVVGVHHEAPGARISTWRASDRTVEEIR